MGKLSKTLKHLLPDTDIPVSGAIIFTNKDVQLTTEAADSFPIIEAPDIKKFLIEEQKQRENWRTEMLNQVADALDAQSPA